MVFLDETVSIKEKEAHKLQKFVLLKASARSGACPVAMVRASSAEHAERSLHNIYPDIGWDVFFVVPYRGTPIIDIHSFVVNQLGRVAAYVRGVAVDVFDVKL